MESLLVRDPRIRITEHTEKEHIVLQGASRLTEYIQISNSFNVNQANWSFSPPSTKIIVDRRIKLKCYVRLTAVGGSFEFGTNDALRQLPLASIMETLDVKLNGGSLSDSVADRIHAMLCYNNSAQQRTELWSESPCMPDAFQNLNDWTLFGSAKCPLKEYAETSVEDTRGGFPFRLVSSTVAEFELTEPLFMSPFNASCLQDEEGFTNVNQIDIQIRWVQNLQRILTHASSGGAISAVNVEFYQAPELLVRYLTPDQNQALPNLQVLPYIKYNDYVRSFTLGAGASSVIISDTLKLNQIPRKLMIFARRSRQTSDYTHADAFANIGSISLLWNNESNLLTSANEQELWYISKRNGCILTYPQWRKYRGSVFMCEFGTDIGLVQGLAPGVMGQFTLQATIQFRNVSSASVDYEFYMTTMLEGSVELTENSLAVNLGNLTVSAVESAEGAPEVMHADAEQATGGSFFSKSKHFFNKLSRGVQGVSKFAEGIAPVVGMLNPAYGAALGAGAGIADRVATAGRMASGGGMAGGRLRRRLR